MQGSPLDVEDGSEELLRQLSYAIKTQPKEPEATYHLCQRNQLGARNDPVGSLDARAGYLWHKRAGVATL